MNPLHLHLKAGTTQLVTLCGNSANVKHPNYLKVFGSGWVDLSMPNRGFRPMWRVQ